MLQRISAQCLGVKACDMFNIMSDGIADVLIPEFVHRAASFDSRVDVEFRLEMLLDFK